MSFYITFGVGTICARMYAMAHGPDEDTIRLSLNRGQSEGWLPKWAGIYTETEFNGQIERHRLQRLAFDWEAVTEHNYGPCAQRESVTA